MEESTGDAHVVEIGESMSPMDVQVLLSWFFEHAEPEEIETTIGDSQDT